MDLRIEEDAYHYLREINWDIIKQLFDPAASGDISSPHFRQLFHQVRQPLVNHTRYYRDLGEKAEPLDALALRVGLREIFRYVDDELCERRDGEWFPTDEELVRWNKQKGKPWSRHSRLPDAAGLQPIHITRSAKRPFLAVEGGVAESSTTMNKRRKEGKSPDRSLGIDDMAELEDPDTSSFTPARQGSASANGDDMDANMLRTSQSSETPQVDCNRSASPWDLPSSDGQESDLGDARLISPPSTNKLPRKHRTSSGSTKTSTASSSTTTFKTRAQPSKSPNLRDTQPSVALHPNALRPIAHQLPDAKSRKTLSYEDKVSMGIALGTHDCLEDSPVDLDNPMIISKTPFIRQAQQNLIEEGTDYDQSFKLVCTSCIIRGLKCTPTVQNHGKDTRQCHNCYRSHGTFHCSHRDPGTAKFQQVRAEYLAGYAKGNFRGMGIAQAMVQSRIGIETTMRLSGQRISEITSRSHSELRFIARKVPFLGRIIETTVALHHNGQASNTVSLLPGDVFRFDGRKQYSGTSFVDASRSIVQKAELQGMPVLCSNCFIDTIYVTEPCNHDLCTHEEPDSARFQCMQTDYFSGYSVGAFTELQNWSMSILSQFMVYSDIVNVYRKSRAAVEEVMVEFADHITAVALRSSQELNFVIERVPLVGFIIDTAGRVSAGFEIELPPSLKVQRQPGLQQPSHWDVDKFLHLYCR
ncbi:hypothetical protein VKT23_014045 [Stygiomarasmius scandens]|uniref:Uncharacterized protein n=1 Tax=Marasmiellus scandens TaxID=2682957 RepID=A0ABR1J6V4_9AGAR